MSIVLSVGNQVLWSFLPIPTSLWHSYLNVRLKRPHIRRQHNAVYNDSSCSHVYTTLELHASNSGVLSSRELRSGDCVSLPTGVQWLVSS